MRIKLVSTFAAVMLALSLQAPADAAAQKIKVWADNMRASNAQTGEVARAEGHVTIEVPGEVRLQSAEVVLYKGSDGKLSRAVFPGPVKIEDLASQGTNSYRSVSNTGGTYDFKAGTFTEDTPQGVFEFDG